MLLKIQFYLILLSIATLSYPILRATLRETFDSHLVLFLSKQLQAPINALNVIEYLATLPVRSIIPPSQMVT